MIKVYISPVFHKEDKADGGIRRVVEAQVKHLHKFGIEVVYTKEEADIINNHGSSLENVPGVPMVNSNHGLYWSRYEWGDIYHQVNRAVTESMRMSQAHTAPSEWVATSLRRGMLIYPEVIYHGVDEEDWDVVETPGDYVLWNKARQDVVSNPGDMNKIAARMPKTNFISTIGDEAKNIILTGPMSYPDMKKLIMKAGVYLATARETFGIGTLEALMCGVPVAGWDWGGQSEIIIHGETGYLAPPGDYEELEKCIRRCFAERERLSRNARQDAIDRWGWEHRIKQYADIFTALYNQKQERLKNPKVSVIVTCHNLAQYLEDALQSVLDQSFEDWECIIVDDQSTDDTEMISRKWEEKDPRFKYFKTPKNLKLSLARNFGVKNSKGEYFIPLDADDMFDEEALGLLSESLDKNSDYHVVYGHLDMVDEQGGNQKRNDWPFPYFSWRGQLAHLNQLPYSAMIRRDVFEKTGGYRERHWRAEDANLWCRLSSFGYRIKKVTERSLLIYRNRNTSKSKGEPGDGDWTQWYPWRLAGSPQEATRRRSFLESGKVDNPHLVPFGVDADPPPGMKFWDVHDYSYPNISVIIPVGPGHSDLLIDAIESVVAQSYVDWEIIVVNDTGEKWGYGLGSPIAGAPYIRLIDNHGTLGVSKSRNLGAAAARGEAFIFLDADDYLLPNAIERFVAQYEVYDGIIYSDWLRNDSDGKDMHEYKSYDFVCGEVLLKMMHAGSSILIPRWVHEGIGGWDEEIKGWEDWDYLIAAQAVVKACSYRIDEPLFVYRFRAGTNRENSYELGEDIVKYIKTKWKDFYKGDKEMACGCKKGKKVESPPVTALSSSGNFIAQSDDQESVAESVILEYIGDKNGPITYRGKNTGKRYRFGKTSGNDKKFVLMADVAGFMALKGLSNEPIFRTLDIKDKSEASRPPELPVPTATDEVRPQFPTMPVGVIE